MLKLFKFTQGLLDYYGTFTDEEEAYDRRAEVDPTFHFTDVRIDEIKLDGYEIIVVPVSSAAEPEATEVTEEQRPQLKWKKRGV